eukprot:1094101-Rhodomonas_salina.2
MPVLDPVSNLPPSGPLPVELFWFKLFWFWLVFLSLGMLRLVCFWPWLSVPVRLLPVSPFKLLSSCVRACQCPSLARPLPLPASSSSSACLSAP